MLRNNVGLRSSTLRNDCNMNANDQIVFYFAYAIRKLTRLLADPNFARESEFLRMKTQYCLIMIFYLYLPKLLILFGRNFVLSFLTANVEFKVNV